MLKLNQFSIKNAVLEQIRRESDVMWAKSEGYMPPIPRFKPIKPVKWGIVAIWGFLLSIRP